MRSLIAVALLLSACAPDQLSTANSNIKQGAAVAQTVLTVAQRAACDAQAGANAAKAAAIIADDSQAIADAAKASAYAGIGCVWPVSPAP